MIKALREQTIDCFMRYPSVYLPSSRGQHMDLIDGV